MIDDLLLRWVVTGLFVLSAAECGFTSLARRRPWTSVLSNGLHFAMAIAMAVMAWPRGAQLPTVGPAVFFGLAGVWFVTLATISARRERVVYVYPAVMMVEMVWMYAVMDSHLQSPCGGHHHASPHTSMPGVDMATKVVQASGPPHGSAPSTGSGSRFSGSRRSSGRTALSRRRETAQPSVGARCIAQVRP